MEIQDIDRQITGLKKLRQALVEAVEVHSMVDITGWTKKQIIEQAWKLPELPDRLMQLIADNEGFRTGSTVYGDPNTANDIDYCVGLPPHVFEPYTIGRGDNWYWEADEFSTVYGHYDGMLINILCFGNFKLMQAWRDATDMLAHMSNTQLGTLRFHKLEPQTIKGILSTKWRRVRIFRALCDAFYTAPQLSTSLSKMEATTYNKCRLCGLEAINFTDKAHKDEWKETGVCERCSSV